MSGHGNTSRRPHSLDITLFWTTLCISIASSYLSLAYEKQWLLAPSNNSLLAVVQHFNLVVYSSTFESDHCFLNVHLSPRNLIFHKSVWLTKTRTFLSSTEVWLGRLWVPKNSETHKILDGLPQQSSVLSVSLTSVESCPPLDTDAPHKKHSICARFRASWLYYLLPAAVIAE